MPDKADGLEPSKRPPLSRLQSNFLSAGFFALRLQLLEERGKKRVGPVSEALSLADHKLGALEAPKVRESLNYATC